MENTLLLSSDAPLYIHESKNTPVGWVIESNRFAVSRRCCATECSSNSITPSAGVCLVSTIPGRVLFARWPPLLHRGECFHLEESEWTCFHDRGLLLPALLSGSLVVKPTIRAEPATGKIRKRKQRSGECLLCRSIGQLSNGMADPEAEVGWGIEQGRWVVAQMQHMAVGYLYRTAPISPRNVTGLAGWIETPRVLLKLHSCDMEVELRPRSLQVTSRLSRRIAERSPVPTAVSALTS